MLPGQGGVQTPGVYGNFYMYPSVTGSGVLNGSLPIVSQFAGIGGIPYPYGMNGANNLAGTPNAALLPPGVALNVAFNTLPGIPATQAQTPIISGFGSVYGNNPYLMNPLLANPFANPFASPWRTGYPQGPVSLGTGLFNSPFKALGNGGSGL